MLAAASNRISAVGGLPGGSQALPAAAIKTPVPPGHVLPDVAAIWRGTEFGMAISTTVASGWNTLDKELPGSGWPCASLAEVLSPQPSVLEWRLIGPALRKVVAKGGQVIVVPPSQASALAWLGP